MPRLHLLGGMEVDHTADARVVRTLHQPKLRALLGLLACSEAFVSRARLISLIWSESDEERGRAALRKSLHLIRKALGEGAVVRQGEGEVGLSRAVVSDVGEFGRALAQGELERAVELYRGELLAGLYVEGSTEFEWWLERERDRLRMLAEQAALTLATRALESGDPAAALAWALRAGNITPGSTEAVRLAMEARERSGATAEALDHFHRYERDLRREYGLTPSATLRALAEKMRAGGREDAAPAPTAASRELRDPVTGLFNLEGFRLLAADRLAVARRLGNSVVLLRISVLEELPAGVECDTVLPPDSPSIAAFLLATLRVSDLIACLREGELVVLAIEPPGQHREAWWRGITARLRAAPGGASVCPWLSLAVGYAGPPHDHDIDQLLAIAPAEEARLAALGRIRIFPGRVAAS